MKASETPHFYSQIMHSTNRSENSTPAPQIMQKQTPLSLPLPPSTPTFHPHFTPPTSYLHWWFQIRVLSPSSLTPPSPWLRPKAALGPLTLLACPARHPPHIHTYSHNYILTSLHTHMHNHMHKCICNTYSHTYINTYLHRHMHTYMYIHAYIHLHKCMCVCLCV